MKQLRFLGLLLLLAVGSAGAGVAHAAPDTYSYSEWSLTGNTVVLRFLLPTADAQRVADTHISVLVQSRVAAYLLDHFAVRAGNQTCEAIDQGYDIGKVDPLTVAAGLYGFEIFFQCPMSPSTLQSRGLVLEDHALFDRLPGQLDFARIQIVGGRAVDQLFTAHSQQLSLPPAVALQPAALSRYLSLGFVHVIGTLDRVLFIFGMVLLVQRPRATLQWLAAVAGGYVLSLPVAVLLSIAPRGELPDALVGFLIVLLGAALALRQSGRRGLIVLVVSGGLLWLAAAALVVHAHWAALLLAGTGLFAAGALTLRGAQAPEVANSPMQWLIPALFGFADGFVFPGALEPLSLGARASLPRLVSFALGSWSAAVALAAVAIGIVALWRWRRPAVAPQAAWSADLSAAVLGGCGIFWLVTRLHA